MVYDITMTTGDKMTPYTEELFFRMLHEHGFKAVYLDTAKPAPGAAIGSPQPSAGPWAATSDPFAKAFKEAPFVSGTGRVLRENEVKVTFSGVQGSGKSQLQRLLLEWCDTHSTATNCTGPHEMIVNTENLNLVTWPKAELAEATKARNGDMELREAIKRQGDHLAGFAKDLTLVTEAGVELCHAALHVVTEFDGVHSLALAASRFMKALADRGGRGEARTANLPDMT